MALQLLVHNYVITVLQQYSFSVTDSDLKKGFPSSCTEYCKQAFQILQEYCDKFRNRTITQMELSSVGRHPNFKLLCQAAYCPEDKHKLDEFLNDVQAREAEVNFFEECHKSLRVFCDLLPPTVQG